MAKKQKTKKIILDGSEAMFDFAETATVTRETYMGKFRVKCFLQPLEKIRADRIYRELIGPVNPILAGDDAKTLAFAIGQLAVRIVKMPEFFKNEENPDLPGGHLPDDILVGILNLAIDAETEFREQQKKEYEATQKRLYAKFKNNTIQKKVDEDEDEIGKKKEQEGEQGKEIDVEEE